jgi:ABC-type Fe3+-hydroxamate transport system substrate-binding protein
MDISVFRRGSIVLASLAALLVAACGGSSSSDSSSSAASPTPKAAITVKTASKTVAGKSETILVDAKGMTLYYFTPDKGGTVTCTAACLEAWPPLLLPSDAAVQPLRRGACAKDTVEVRRRLRRAPGAGRLQPVNRLPCTLR